MFIVTYRGSLILSGFSKNYCWQQTLSCQTWVSLFRGRQNLAVCRAIAALQPTSKCATVNYNWILGFLEKFIFPDFSNIIRGVHLSFYIQLFGNCYTATATKTQSQRSHWILKFFYSLFNYVCTYVYETINESKLRIFVPVMVVWSDQSFLV